MVIDTVCVASVEKPPMVPHKIGMATEVRPGRVLLASSQVGRVNPGYPGNHYLRRSQVGRLRHERRRQICDHLGQGYFRVVPRSRAPPLVSQLSLI